MKTNNKKIYLIYEFLSELGGLERLLILHSNYLKDRGYDVKILTCHLDKKILKSLPFNGLDIEEIGKFKTPFEALNLILCFMGFNNLKKYNPDAFLSYSSPCNFLIRNKKCKKINYINHYPHFLYLSNKEKFEWAKSTPGFKRWLSVIMSWFIGGYLMRLDKKLIKTLHLRFVNSLFTKNTIEKVYGVKTILSYPPVDPMFQPVKDSISEKFIFSSSRIIPDKKPEWLIQAVAEMKRKLPLYISGSVNPSYSKELIKMAKKFKVNLRFLGRLSSEDLVKTYSSASVFAFQAPKEDFGLVPAESLSCGTPVIVWGDGAGPTEQIIDGLNGYYAKPYDIKDFADKLDKVLNENLKIKNRKQIIDSSKKFSASEVKKSFIKEIDSVLDSRP
jgi:glycosyltransferase involved in cell wall biosynthesis